MPHTKISTPWNAGLMDDHLSFWLGLKRLQFWGCRRSMKQSVNKYGDWDRTKRNAKF